MKAHMPLYRVLMASLVSYIVVALIHYSVWTWDFYRHSGFWFMFTLGWLAYYVNFEYGWHRVAMHIRFTFKWPKWLAAFLADARKQHLEEHHRRHYGKKFRSLDPEDIQYRISPPYLFPVLFGIHYLLFRIAFSPHPLVAFLAGITWGYMLFETIHWFTHTPSVLDRIASVMSRTPILRLVLCPIWWPWLYLQRHHRLHHEEVECNFSFTIPVDDVLFGTFRPAPKDFTEYEK